MSTVNDLRTLANGATVQDKYGDIGVISGDFILYPETANLTLAYANRYGPFKVLSIHGDRL